MLGTTGGVRISRTHHQLMAPPMARNNASASDTAMGTRRFNGRCPRRRSRSARTPGPSSRALGEAVLARWAINGLHLQVLLHRLVDAPILAEFGWAPGHH